MSKNSFFNEIVENIFFGRLNIYVFGVGIGVLLLWVYNTFLTIDPVVSGYAVTFMIMLIVWGFALTNDIQWSNQGEEDPVAVNGLGTNPGQAIALGIMAAIALIVVVQFSIVPFDLTTFSVVDTALIGFLFVVIAAPIVEANFFRGLIMPLFTLVFDIYIFQRIGATESNSKRAGWIASLILTNLAFAFFHINVISGGATDLFAYLPYFIFGVLATVGVYANKSIGFEWGLHGVNNLIAWLV